MSTRIKILLIAHPDGDSGSSLSIAMPRKRVLEAALPQDRAAQRRRLGSLRELTVQPATKKRYSAAVEGFFSYLRKAQTSLPHRKSELDPIVSDYIEFLWSTGAGRALAADTLAGLQDIQPNLRGNLPGSWRLLKTWSINEIPARAPPCPEHVVHAMAGWAFFKGWYAFGVSLMLGFYSMLRTGELHGLRSSHLLCGRHDKGLPKEGRDTARPKVLSSGLSLLSHW